MQPYLKSDLSIQPPKTSFFRLWKEVVFFVPCVCFFKMRLKLLKHIFAYPLNASHLSINVCLN